MRLKGWERSDHKDIYRPRGRFWLSLHSIHYSHWRWFSWLIPVIHNKMNMHLYISNWKQYKKKINILIFNFGLTSVQCCRERERRFFLKVGRKEAKKKEEEGQKWKKPTQALRLQKTKGLTGDYVSDPDFHCSKWCHMSAHLGCYEVEHSTTLNALHIFEDQLPKTVKVASRIHLKAVLQGQETNRSWWWEETYWPHATRMQISFPRNPSQDVTCFGWTWGYAWEICQRPELGA